MCEKRRSTPNELRRTLAQCPLDGSRWTHAKTGRRYSVVGRAVIEANLKPGVLYVSSDDGLTWVRPLSEWLERFRLVD